jgi:outer membrane receptor protein involved in Fe transport
MESIAAATLFLSAFMTLGVRAEESGSADNAGTALDEIIVTASKRVSTVQDTPISISAVSGNDLMARGVASLADLAQGTPGVSLKSEGPSQTEIEMRGMTSSGGNSATVGFYLDDIPLTGPASAQNGHVVIDPDLYDLNRIEILRGPQGTLFGSGSMGGTVRLISNQPNLSQFLSTAQSVLSGTQGGGFNHKDNLMVNLPLIDDTLAVRLVGTEDYTSGWIDRIVADPFPLAGGEPLGTVRGDVQDAPIERRYPGSNAYQIYAARVTLLWKPMDEMSVTPSFFHETSTQNGISAYDSVPGTETHYQPFDIAEPLTDSLTAYSLNVNYGFPLAYATVSTGFRPGGGNAAYPTTGAAWGSAFQQQNYTSGKWPATYEPDRVLSYELGEKARFLDQRVTVNASVYYEDWRHVQLEVYPNDLTYRF